MGKGRGQLRAVERMERWGKQVSDSTTGWTNRTKLGLGSLGLGSLAIGAGIGAYLYTRGTEKSATNENTHGTEKSATNETDWPGDTNMHLKGSQDKSTRGYRMVIPASKGSGAKAAPLDENQKGLLLALLNDDETSEIGSGGRTLSRLDDGGFAWNSVTTSSVTTIRKPEVGRIILDVAGNIKVVDAPKEGEWGDATTTTKKAAMDFYEFRTWIETSEQAALLVHVAMMRAFEESFPGARIPGTDRSQMTATALSLDDTWLEYAATCTPTDEGLECTSGNVQQLLVWPHPMSRPPEPVRVDFGHKRASRRPVAMYTE